MQASGFSVCKFNRIPWQKIILLADLAKINFTLGLNWSVNYSVGSSKYILYYIAILLLGLFVKVTHF